MSVAYPGFARGGCPKKYAHAHNVGGRGPRTRSHAASTDATKTGQFYAVRVASARAYPRTFLAFVGWPRSTLASYRRWTFHATNRKSD